MINKLLITCLQRNKRLVLPTLGAFIRKNIDGVGVVLVFVPFLHKDDGVLHSAIKSWAGVEDDEATQILTEYISAIRRSLDERGKYNIEGVGILKYDINNIISLAKETQEDVAPNSEESVKKPEVASTPEVVADPVTVVAPPVQTTPTKPIVTSPVAPQQTAAPVAPVTPTAPIQQQPVVETQQQQPSAPEVQQTHSTPSEPKVPLYRKDPIPQPVYQKPIDMGARYFSPERDHQTLVDTNIDKFSRGYNPTSTTEPQNRPSTQQQSSSHTSSRADVTSTFNRQRQQSRISDLYGSKTSQSSEPQQQQQPSRAEGSRSGILRGGNKTQPKRRKQTKKGKNNDIVLIIAVVAIVLTLIILIYGYMYGGEQSLESLDVYDPIENVDNGGDVL